MGLSLRRFDPEKVDDRSSDEPFSGLEQFLGSSQTPFLSPENRAKVNKKA